MCVSSTRGCPAHFPPLDQTSIAQTCELNRSRTEARCLIAFDTSPATVGFPFVEQAARLTRCSDSQGSPAKEIETEYLLSSLPASKLNAQQMLRVDRGYWDIETGLHLRLDVSAGEDRSRVSNRTSALNLAMMRRAAVSVAVHWIRKCANPRQATTSGFFDLMHSKQASKAFSLVTTCHPSWLPNS